MNKLIPLLIFLLPVSTRAQALSNPGFEREGQGWTITPPMASIRTEAAQDGKFGLRVTDESEEAGSSILSERLPVEPGAPVELTFLARTESPGFIGVYLWFYDAAGKLIKDESQRAGQGHPVVGVSKADGQWNAYSLKSQAPETAATVSVWIHSFGKAKGVADFDDFEIRGTTPSTGMESPKPAPPVATTTPSVPRAKPPVIIIKVDDMRQIDGRVNGLWIKLTDFLKARNIKAAIGVLTSTLGEATPQYTDWIKAKQASGDIEFWFHGWDHATHEVEGVKFNEFNKRSYEEQKQRFEDSQKLALEKFGFSFATFGPPGGASNGSFDATTIRVVSEDPHMKVWLYPQPLDDAGKKLEAEGKVTILDRVWPVNIESKVGQPDFQKFVEGYAKYPDREYFVLQGHPMNWGDPARFAEFEKIIDFLIEQKAVFMTPSEFAALKARKS